MRVLDGFRRLGFFSLSALIAAPLSLMVSSPVQALSGSEFQAGDIIDNATFFNRWSMNAGQIQAFLNVKVPACDHNGAKIYSGSTTRAQYAATKGVGTPFTCMRDYAQNTPVMPAQSGLCGHYAGGHKTAAQIIADVGISCEVNPQVLLVLLQKEQSLVTDEWPWPIQYEKATGFACPDTAPCDPSYAGFFYQVYNAARQFKRYARDANVFNYRSGRTNDIRYNPNAACGSSQVFIQNQATAGLYNYTPYQPNAAALNNLYGTGDGCSAYGNRNFWRMFRDWFGPTHYFALPGCHAATNTTLSCVWELRKIGTDTPVFATSIGERDHLVIHENYIYEGIAFYGNVNIAPVPGNIPVYRLKKPDGASFLTTNTQERTALLASGFTDMGVEFYGGPAGANSGFGVKRLYSPSLNRHIWTTDAYRAQELVSAGYTDEGEAFTSVTKYTQEFPPPAGQKLVYRFSMPNRSHFWTTDLYERDVLIERGYSYEGVAWRSLIAASSKPIYRLYSQTMQRHLYTLDAYERDVLSSTPYWQYEGVSQYMSPTPNSRPVYRLYSPITTNHLWTTDAWERHVLAQSGTFNDEGIAWYQP